MFVFIVGHGGVLGCLCFLFSLFSPFNSSSVCFFYILNFTILIILFWGFQFAGAYFEATLAAGRRIFNPRRSRPVTIFLRAMSGVDLLGLWCFAFVLLVVVVVGVLLVVVYC